MPRTERLIELLETVNATAVTTMTASPAGASLSCVRRAADRLRELTTPFDVEGVLEHFPTWRNRKGFPCEANCDSPLGLVMEASRHGQTPLAGPSSSHYSGGGR
jgi:hypothetical protein